MMIIPARLEPLDVVRTKKGTLAVVDKVSPYKTKNKVTGKTKTFYSYSIVLPSCSNEHIAWYEREELEYISTVTELVLSKWFK
jgi:hypothetical protein